MTINFTRNFLFFVFLFLFLWLGAPSMASAQEIKITEFMEGDSIAGIVKKVSADDLKQMKVLIYLQTNKLWIHPYTHGGDHEAFSYIDSNGNWWVKSEHRSPSPSRIYAFLVNREYTAPATAESFREINYAAYDYAPYSEEEIKERSR